MSLHATVVVPTFNERGNVEELDDRLQALLCGTSHEILFVDDSTDDTADVVRRVAARCPEVRLVQRVGAERTGGLSGAVTRGIAEARGRWVVVMDGDLQHPPELVPDLIALGDEEGADLVVASRYVGQGDASGLSSSWRRTVSSASTLLARTLFPRRVGRLCTDPMTGFFCVSREAVDLSRLRPRGFKILFEILASHRLRVLEVPFVFGTRHSGASKASWRQGAEFVHQLLSLRAGRVLRFAAVGATGVVVNLGVMGLLLREGMHYVPASLVSTELAIISNFLLQERFVFRSGDHEASWRRRAAMSLALNNVDNFLRVPLLLLLVGQGGLSALLAQAVAVAVGFALRFTVLSGVVYRARRLPEAPSQAPEAPRVRAA
jgi:dolichol-phosphate mannosyltransferase